MDIISTSPLRVASILWRPARDAWALTVVCKATYRLEPGVSPLHDEQDPPNEEDTHWNDDPSRSLASCTDLAPFKSRADVLLVGHAFAPGGRPVRSLIARIVVGEVDKAIEVFGPRMWTQSGELREGQPFVTMPLRYERAAGGSDTSNPVGVPLTGLPDAQGNVALPNLQPPGIVLAGRTTSFAAIGFGPISPTWPSRTSLLGGYREMFSRSNWREQPLPREVDAGFFNAAPRDQQLEMLQNDERITLENLHPKHARLVTKLPGLSPHALVERPRGAAKEFPMRADTLIIDTDRGIAALVWRGNVPLMRPDEAGRVVVGIEERGRHHSEANGPERANVAETMTLAAKIVAKPALPFAALEGPRSGNAPERQAPPISEPRPLPVAPPPMMITPVSAPDVPTVLPASMQNALPAADKRGLKMGAWRGSGGKDPEPAKNGSAGSALAVSNAAARIESANANERAAAAPAEIPIPQVSGEAVELIWFDSKLVSRIRRQPAWKKILTDLKNAKPKGRDDEGEDDSRENRQEAKDRREVLAILRRAEAIDLLGLNALLSDAMEEDMPAPPLALVAGEPELPFDEMETLKAMLAVVAPFVPGDKRLKETVDVVGDMLKAPGIERARGVAEAMIARIREAFGQMGRGISPGYLDAQTEPMLLEGRCYQKRAVMGGEWLRAHLRNSAAQGEPGIAVYLPEVLKNELPMFRRFRVRIIGEVRERVDQYESAEVALKVVGMGRVGRRTIPSRI